MSAVAFSAVLALLLIALATPRLVSGIITAPFDETVRALGRGADIPVSDIRFARSSRVTALGWYSSARYAADLGALNFTLARREPPGSAGRSELLDAAIAADRLDVELAPTAPFSWMRLAQANIEREGLRADIARYLQMSYRTAPTDPRLVLPRLDLALAVWNDLPPDVQAETAGQVRLAMRWFPGELVQRTRARYRLAEVREALREDPGARARFNLLYFRASRLPVSDT
ncbi:MAG: hypothetical protein JJ899_01530 [Alphaproteobacteria bacterium]|nr:hypothetical protein [Alphaproteobacteria bacterium]